LRDSFATVRRLGLLAVLTISAMLAAAPARAIEPYAVAGVAVEVEGPDDEATRATALAEASVLAWQRLVDRLVLPEDKVGAPALSAAEIAPLLASHEVESEAPTSRSYAASFRFRFLPDAVAALLAASGLRFTEAIGRPLVVLPLFGKGEAAVLWGDPNPWRQAWANYRDQDGLVPLVVPLGELQDLALVDAPQAVAGDERAMADLAALHAAGGVLVLQAELGSDAKTKLPRVSVRSQGYGTAAVGPISFGLTAEPDESEDRLWQRAAETAAALIQLEWKRLTAVSYGTQSSLRAQVTIAALQDWLLARQILEASPFVIAVQVLSLSQSRADIVIEHRGTAEQLSRALAQNELFLQQGAGGWELRLGANVTKLNPKPLAKPPGRQ